MSNQQPNCQQQHENKNDQPEQKSQKLDENEVEPIVIAFEAETEAISITNMYYDCLKRIFDFLDLASLLNLAQTCKRLQIAAAAKFSGDHGNKMVWLYPFGSWIQNSPELYTERTQIEVIGLKFCFPFLRCFGAELLNLSLFIKLQSYGGYSDGLFGSIHQSILCRHIDEHLILE